MINQNNQVTCPTCGFRASLEEFEQNQGGSGVWCCDCQTFIWHNPLDNHQSSTILLETKSSSPASPQGTSFHIPHKFNKRLSPLRYPGGKSKLIDYLSTKLLSSNAPVNPPERAWAYLLVNRLSYSGIQKAGCLGGRNGSEKALLARYNPKALIKQINHFASLKDHITLLNKDYAEVIEEFYWNDRCTQFIDPPYYKQGKTLYKHYFTEEDHRALAELIQSLTLEFPNCADVLITYDNNPFIQDLYWFMQQTAINRKYSI